VFKRDAKCTPATTTLKINAYSDNLTIHNILKDLQKIKGVTNVIKTEYTWPPQYAYTITADYWNPRRLLHQIGDVFKARTRNRNYVIGNVQHVHIGVKGMEDPKRAITAMVALEDTHTELKEWLLTLPQHANFLCHAGFGFVSNDTPKEVYTPMTATRPSWLTTKIIENWGYIEAQSVASGKTFKECAYQVRNFYKILSSFD
jgi:hypothetical protein